MKLYHGTSESRARKIMDEGLKPRGKSGKTNWKHTVESNPKAVYLTDTYPLYFAFTACGDSDERWAVIEVDTDLLDESKLHPDEDVLEQAGRNHDGLPGSWGMVRRTRWYRKQAIDNPNWDKSLKFMGTCGYYGTIPPEAITRVVFFDPKKHDTGFVLSCIDASISLMNFKFCSKKYKGLLRWVMGEKVKPEETGYWMEDQLPEIEKVLADRSGIEEVNMLKIAA
jgi:hypothetical protein